MHQVDAQWEQLTQSIQADQSALEGLQTRLANFHRLLELDSQDSRASGSTLLAQIASLEAQIVQLKTRITEELSTRGLLEQEFDDSYLAQSSSERGTSTEKSKWEVFVNRFLNALLQFIRKLDRGARKLADAIVEAREHGGDP